MTIFRLLAATALAALTSTAGATTYKFQYDFFQVAHPLVKEYTVSGTFDGTANGNQITGLSNVNVDFDFLLTSDATLHLASNELTIFHLDANAWVPRGGVASFDGLQNNFMFLIVNPDHWNERLLYAIPAVYRPNGNTTINYTHVRAANKRNTLSPKLYADNHPLSSNTAVWSLTPIPEPETYAMLLAGLGLMGAVARRRARQQS